MPMNSGYRKAWGSDAVPDTEGAAGSSHLGPGSMLEKGSEHFSPSMILCMTMRVATAPPHPRKAQMVPKIPYRFARFLWFIFFFFLFAQDNSLVGSIWFISEFSQIIFLSVFINFQVNNLIVNE